MTSKVISMQRRKGKDTPKPELRRSVDCNYENLVEEVSQITSFDRANDPPLLDEGSIQSLATKSTHDSFYQLSLNTIEMPAAFDHANGSASVAAKKQAVPSETEGPTNAIGLFSPDWPNLQVVKVASSDDEASAKPASIPQSVVQVPDPNGTKESGGAASRTRRSEFHPGYSTDKPHNFSMQESPVKKLENTLNSLDCSFDVNLKSIDADKSAAQESVFESKWINFSDPFLKQRSAPESAEVSFSSHVPGEVSFSSHVPEEENNVFAPSVFEGGDNTDAANGSASDSRVLIMQLEERLASLERIVHGISDPTTMRVSDSTHSDQSPDSQTQDIDMGFIIEGTEILSPSANEEVSSLAVWGEGSKKKTKGGKFSVKRLLGSRFFRNKGGTRPSLAEV